MTIENVLAAQERHGVDISVISNHTPYMRHSEPEPILVEHREINKYLAEQQHKHSGKIYALACSVPNGRDDYLKELERAVKVDGMKGVMIRASHQHAYPDDDEAKPFFKLCCDLDVPVVMHPPPVGFGEERMKDYRLASSVGRPADNCLALARLIVRGIFEEFPKLKLVATHLGGGICEVIGRMAVPPRNARTFKVRALLRLRPNKFQTDVWQCAPADGNVAATNMPGTAAPMRKPPFSAVICRTSAIFLMSTRRAGSIRSVSICTMTSVPPANTRAGPVAPASKATAACSVAGASYLRSVIKPPSLVSSLARS